MPRKYSELLPAYLAGPNIRKHAEIIEKQDMILYQKLCELGLWNQIDRPILIEKIQSEPAVATMKVHIHSPSPIKSIKIKEYPTNNQTYTEDEVVTDTTTTFQVYSEIPPVMEDVTVTLETYDGLTFKKGYPENDTKMDNIKDHDEFLDFIGALFNIPRRIYKELDYSFDLQSFYHIYPPFFTKTPLTGHHVGDILTEDDYYYAQRLKKFINKCTTTSLPILMTEILYEWTDIEAVNMCTITTSIADDNVDYIGEPVLNLIFGTERYRNMDYTNMEEILNRYSPITRPLLLSEPKEITNGLLDSDGSYINDASISQEFEYTSLPYELDKYGTIAFLPVKTTFTFEDDNEVERTYYTDIDGNFEQSIVGLPPGDVEITTEPVIEHEFRDDSTEYSTSLSIEDTLDILLSKWTYVKYWGYTGSSRVTPVNTTFLGDPVLDTGRGYLVYTPVYDTLFGYTDYKISISFDFTTKYPRIGFGKLKQRSNPNDEYQLTKMFYLLEYMDTSEFGAGHVMDIQVLDGVAYFYIDNTYIGESLTVPEGLNYIGGYNTLVIKEISVSTTTNITEPPTGGGGGQ